MMKGFSLLLFVVPIQSLERLVALISIAIVTSIESQAMEMNYVLLNGVI
jgi:hypothetical protein